MNPTNNDPNNQVTTQVADGVQMPPSATPVSPSGVSTTSSQPEAVIPQVADAPASPAPVSPMPKSEEPVVLGGTVPPVAPSSDLPNGNPTGGLQ